MCIGMSESMQYPYTNPLQHFGAWNLSLDKAHGRLADGLLFFA